MLYAKHRWGRQVELLVDIDRDGRMDARGLYAPGSTEFFDPIVELWEDRDNDGKLETHSRIDGSKILRLEIDEDADGKPDKILSGDEARAYYEALPLPSHYQQKSQ